MDNSGIIDQIKAIKTLEDMAFVDAQLRAGTDRLDPDVQDALVDRLRQLTDDSKALREEAISVLRVHGVDYPLTDWLTPKNYAKRFELKSGEVVLNWINRGIIPPENIKEIPELGLRLVKAVEYSPRAYKQTADRQ